MDARSVATTSDWPFTPEVEGGGWQVEKSNDHWGSYFVEDFVEPDYDDDEDMTRAEQEDIANVNLIAAAPRMYRLLKEAYDGAPDTTEYWGRLKDVIDWIDQR